MKCANVKTIQTSPEIRCKHRRARGLPEEDTNALSPPTADDDVSKCRHLNPSSSCRAVRLPALKHTQPSFQLALYQESELVYWTAQLEQALLQISPAHLEYPVLRTLSSQLL